MERDTERKEAMKDFEDWRSGAQNPILSDIEGKPQENRKAYRCTSVSSYWSHIII